MVIAPDNMRNAHIVIVHHDGKHIGRRSIGAEQHEIVYFRILDSDRALHLVGDGSLPIQRCFQANDKRRAIDCLCWIAIAPSAVIADGLLRRTLLLAHLLQLLGGCITAISLAFRSEEHTSELQSLMRISYAVFCLKT